MAKTSLINKCKLTPKFSTRKYTRCLLCGRPRAVYQKFKVCRICLRSMALRGEVPGMRKASW